MADRRTAGGGLNVNPSRRQLAAMREHWQHGPIDLVIDAWGDMAAVRAAHDAAWHRFQGVLAELVSELPLLRAPAARHLPLRGVIARRMLAATLPFAHDFITPMAAVAGSVAEEIVAFFAAEAGVTRACVNNGGDIAVHLAPGQYLSVGIVTNACAPLLDGAIELHSAQPVRGVATSGWRGRSFSLGIADSVTVLAHTASAADAAATMIANAVDVAHPAIARAPADSLRDDTDLGARLVTVGVGALPAALRKAALERGSRVAAGCAERGLIAGAALALQGEWRTIGALLHKLPRAA